MNVFRKENRMRHKLCFLFVLVCLTGSLAVGDAIFIENPSFEDPYTGHTNNATPTGWSVDGSSWGTEVGPYDGDQCMFVGSYGDDHATLFQLTDHSIAAGDEYTLTFYAKFTWNSGNWPGVYEGSLYYDTGDGTRNTLDTIGASFNSGGWGEGESYSWVRYDLVVPIPAGSPAIGSKLGFAYQNLTGGTAGWGSWTGCDLVSIENINANIAKGPTPPNGETLVDPGTIFDWSAPAAYTPTGYKMSLRAGDPNFAGGGNILDGASVTPPYDHPTDLGFETEYFWRIDSIEDGTTTHEGTIWSFTTSPANPVITAQPVPLTVATGDTAEFTVEGVNITTFTWKKASDGSVVQTDEGGDSSTLTIDPVSQDDEDYYYCEASNAAGTDTSDSVRLLTKRLVARWTFEGNVDDSVEGLEGVYTDPNLDNPLPVEAYSEDSIEGGQSFDFDAMPYFIKVDDAEFFNFSRQGVSISAWVKVTTQPNGWDSYIMKTAAYYLNAQSSWRTMLSGNESNDPILEDNGWHYTVAAFDPVDGVWRYYVDGVFDKQFGGNPGPHADNLIFGASDETGRGQYTGLLDDVQIYSYPLDGYEIAHLYTDLVADVEICVDRVGIDLDVSGPDGEPDCRVDIYDFAALAAQWLNCNSVPDCV